MRKIASLSAVCLAFVGCTLANLTPQERFKDSTHTLNEASRWGRVDIASEQVSPKYRERFVARHRDWGTTLSIADSDVTRMQIADDRKTALSEISVSWYQTGGISLRSSVITQQWEIENGNFRLVDEAIRVGDPNVFVEEEQTAGGDQTEPQSDPKG